MANRRADRARVSREAACWAVIIVAAMTMRLAGLGRAPLSAAEARQANWAWRAAGGQGLPTEGYSPLLLVANSMLFWMVGATDALARFWPAVFGAALALTPALLRRRLGRVGALGSGLYLALSPTALVASRQVEGTILAAAGTMAFVGGLDFFFEKGERGWLVFAVLGLAFAVLSGAAAYGLLLPLGVAWVVCWRLWPSGGAATHTRRALDWMKSNGAQFLLVFAVAALALSTGLGWHPSGAGAVGDVLADWFRRFRDVETPTASPMTLLIVYEMLGGVLGIGALLWGLRRKRQWSVLLGLWAGLAALLLLVMPGHGPTDLVWVVVPLAMLSGLAIRAIVCGQWSGRAGVRWIYAAIVLILWVQVYLMLASYAAFGQPTSVVLVVIVGGLQVLLGLSFGLVLGPRVMVRTAAATTGMALLALLISAGWGAAYGSPGDPREALLSRPTSENVYDLVETLRAVSWRERGMPTTLNFVYAAPEDSVLAWYFRGFEGARRLDGLTELYPDGLTSVVVTLDHDGERGVSPGAEYVGQEFPLERQWTPRAMGCRLWEADCRVALRWFLFRDGPPLPDAVLRAVLWRRVEREVGEQ